MATELICSSPGFACLSNEFPWQFCTKSHFGRAPEQRTHECDLYAPSPKRFGASATWNLEEY